MKAVLALDQGTTSSRAILYNHSGDILGVAQKEFSQIYPKSGWVEHNPIEIWDTQLAVARQVLSDCRVDAKEVAAIGITNQRETTVVWDRTTGEPVYNAIVWQDRRTADYCDLLKSSSEAAAITARTGLVVDPYFSGTKLRWILDHVPQARARAQKGELAFGTIDTWLLWKLTQGRVHKTDSSNASRTMLMNLESLSWDLDLLKQFEIPDSLLPQIVRSSEIYGQSDPALFGSEIPIAGIAGDQQAALFGQNCTQIGMAKNTYGTGCFMLMNVGPKPIPSTQRLLSSVGWTRPNQQCYVLEGSVFIAGAAIQWLRDGLGIIKSASEVEALAKQVPDSDGVYLVPAFAGLGAPHWDAYARGTIVGITRGTTAAHLARAALEGIAFQVADVLTAMEKDSSSKLTELRVDGGASANNLLMQFQADVMQCPVVRPKIIETTSLGAAYLAGLATGFWKNDSEIQSIWQADRRFEPMMSPREAQARRERWADALDRSRQWVEKG
ncbi:MAG: glycerol kinase GlpK [Planctomycetes bacterium]|nr:glycerol kinase GlpK [Planctomycetota bacterium]